MARRLEFLIILTMGICLSTLAAAETITLTTGEQITGPILEKTDAYVMVEMSGLPRTYYWGEIQSIDGQDAQTPPAQAVAAAPVEQVKQEDAPKAQSDDQGQAKSSDEEQAKFDDEEQSLIRFMNVRSTDMQKAAAAPAAAPLPVVAPVVTAPVAAPAPVAPAPAAVAAPAASAPQDPPTLQVFLDNMFGSKAPAAVTPVVAASATAASPAPAVAAPAASTPAPAAAPQDPPTLKQFLQNVVAFIKKLIFSL